MWSLGLLVALPILVAVVLVLVSRQFRQWYRLRHIKGPFTAAVSDIWMLRSAFGGNMWRDFGEICDEYGAVARVGPNEVITDDIESFRRMWGARSRYTKSNWYTAFRFEPTRDSLLTQRDSKIHDEVRRKMIAGYSGKENELLEQTIDNHVRGLVHLIESHYLSTSSTFRRMDLARITQYFTMDVITDLAFGHAFGFMIKNEDVHDYIATVRSMLPAMNFFSVYPGLHGILRSQFMKKYVLPSESDPTGLGKVIGVAKGMVAERFTPDQKDHPDMLGSFVRHGLGQEEAESEVLLQIVAGSDTTATGIRTSLLHIITSPTAYDKLRSEIRGAARDDIISSPIQEEESKKLPYLQACIKEGLRMCPPVSAAMFKNAPPEGDTIAGTFIPGGTKVGICWWGLSRNKNIYGDDADMFRPERWLEADGERLDRMEKTNDLIFSPGRWQCLGKSVALLELNKCLGELFRHFDFQLIDPTQPWKSFNAGIFIQSDMFVRVTKYEE